MKSYINEANPDLVFCFGVPDSFNYYLVRYIKNCRGIPVVSYYLDDHYKSNLPIWNIYRRIRNKRLVELAILSNRRYGITKMMCEAYSKKMGVDFKLLTKGCIVNSTSHRVNKPIRVVYAGNLLYGREKTLIQLVSVIKDINQKSGNKLFLDIFTSTTVKDEVLVQLVFEGVSSVNPPKPYSEIMEIMKQTDIVLHVESFDKSQIDYVHYSFSTKITDCMQSGAMVLAIGPAKIASMDFLSNVPGVVVITDMRDFFSTMSNLIDNPQQIIKNANETSDYAQREMSVDKIRDELHSDFSSLLH